MWTDRQLQVLINKRKNENDNFHELSGNMKHNFWKGLASKINLEFRTTYTGRQCKEKFNGLVRAYKKMLDGQPKGKRSALGAKYYEEFSQQTIYDIAHEINTMSHTTTQSSSPLHSPIYSPISPLCSHSLSSPTPFRHSSPTPYRL
ncbi:uncharacterized protein OCT59_010857 [Rhizophagus irregularis]|uniref:Myb/SANT-like DNA-binding domain-containing protein n=2 Tax=Rhizophagus irregularis TaxID=588596 RepID=A0A015LGM3_RHIIW|nr:hypothetical protein GLOIN_2v1874283 [Rhizophagus irregularis DAOM 181602=DAOM 197198]EXX53382.1 hypothetical protein RirG_244440 [Rhizophagus irregularis DAOM 197198w]UZO19575.1 hypothetical protein OCT59_010857 [Rhizophagus irregularis]EXX71751.1 hypothetical protein RirG_075680 [Rhizophagus irregularis DAOM 197198w]POG73483.1 hypothetical protein GLOIN_2v1874283 [Rhizophagus irregularis DAOM 181602=DAOM 197198]GBC12948.1 hypothetical protein GLOIN_2v1874283 [Rhizophagus irregularis DAOM |eukprot:XP_025180349.1 hypothetical protein GLOIN_2v1874283 [Rhizophagus irregularis DAOM 181602=DAOM 197198]